MNISEAFKALGDQHLEEQNILGKGLSLGVSTVKDYIEGYKLKKFYDKVDKIGPSAIKDSPYQNNKEVALKVVEMEREFRSIQEGKYWIDQEPELAKPLTKDETQRSKAYGQNRKTSSVSENLNDELRNDLEFARHLTKTLGGSETKSMTRNVMDDFEIAENSVDYEHQMSFHNSGLTLKDCSPRLQDDKDFVLLAVKKDYKNIEFASDRMKDDKDVAMAAWRCCGPDGLSHASDRVLNDKEFAREVLKQDSFKLEKFGTNVRSDKELVYLVVKDFPEAIEDATQEVRDIAGNKNQAENLLRAIQAEKLSDKLDFKLALKNEAPAKKMKI